MRSYYTVPRILETWRRAERAGINTMVTNNETPHVLAAVREYVAQNGALQWIAQVNCRSVPDMAQAVDEVVGAGCAALYFHGALIDGAYARGDEDTVRAWCAYARAQGVPVGVAAHAPEAHLGRPPGRRRLSCGVLFQLRQPAHGQGAQVPAA